MINIYAIQNIKTKKFVFGTDFRCARPNKKFVQRTSDNQMLTFPDYDTACIAFNSRGCGKDYRIVVLKTIEIKRIIDFDNDDGYKTLFDKGE